LEELGKVKASAAERLEAKVKAALAKRDRLLEALTAEITSLEGKLAKAKELWAKLGGKPEEYNCPPVRMGPPATGLVGPGPLRGFRSNGRQPPEPVDALIREGKIG
jgi:hypothetical protein